MGPISTKPLRGSNRHSNRISLVMPSLSRNLSLAAAQAIKDRFLDSTPLRFIPLGMTVGERRSPLHRSARDVDPHSPGGTSRGLAPYFSAGCPGLISNPGFAPEPRSSPHQPHLAGDHVFADLACAFADSEHFG